MQRQTEGDEASGWASSAAAAAALEGAGRRTGGRQATGAARARQTCFHVSHVSWLAALPGRALHVSVPEACQCVWAEAGVVRGLRLAAVGGWFLVVSARQLGLALPLAQTAAKLRCLAITPGHASPLAVYLPADASLLAAGCVKLVSSRRLRRPPNLAARNMQPTDMDRWAARTRETLRGRGEGKKHHHHHRRDHNHNRNHHDERTTTRPLLSRPPGATHRPAPSCAGVPKKPRPIAMRAAWRLFVAAALCHPCLLALKDQVCARSAPPWIHCPLFLPHLTHLPPRHSLKDVCHPPPVHSLQA